LETDDLRDTVEVDIVGEQGGSPAPGNGGNHAVDHPARGHAAAAATSIDAGGSVEVGCGVEMKESSSLQKAPKITFPYVGARPGQYLHDYRFRDHERAAMADEFSQAIVNRTPARSVVLDPG